MSVDRPTRFAIAWAYGPSEDVAAPGVVTATRRRTHGQRGVPWVSDGRRVYRRLITQVYRDPQRSGRPGRPRLVRTPGVRLTQAVKRRRKGRVVGVVPRAVGGPVSSCPYVVYEERLNGVLRDRLNCLTRKTHAFAKDTPTWDAAVTLALFEHNWLRPQRALRVPLPAPEDGRHYQPRSPAMAIGLTDHIWTWDEFLHYRHYQHQRE